MKKIIIIVFTLCLSFLNYSIYALDESDVSENLNYQNINLTQLRKLGHDVLPIMVAMYKKSDDLMKARIAWTFYNLGWESDAAYDVLMKDLGTQNPQLRLQVQWAIGRVNSNNKTIPSLLEIMKNDPNPLFRDKAACALASDQIHINDEQRLDLLAGLIGSLSDSKLQVRALAIKALQVQTGQTKGFVANSSAIERNLSIGKWKKWLIEYRSSY